jgi:hypothetical protein
MSADPVGQRKNGSYRSAETQTADILNAVARIWPVRKCSVKKYRIHPMVELCPRS